MAALRHRVSIAVVVSLVAAIPLIATDAARATTPRHVTPRSVPPGTLRFSAPTFATNGCVAMTLTYSGGLTPKLDVISKATKDHEHVALSLAKPGVFTSTSAST